MIVELQNVYFIKLFSFRLYESISGVNTQDRNHNKPHFKVGLFSGKFCHLFIDFYFDFRQVYSSALLAANNIITLITFQKCAADGNS